MEDNGGDKEDVLIQASCKYGSARNWVLMY